MYLLNETRNVEKIEIEQCPLVLPKNGGTGSGNGDAPGLRVALTIDIHDDDNPSDIAYCHEWLQQAGLRATFFIPTKLLTHPRFREQLHGLSTWRHELATHGHLHDAGEIHALKSNGASDLGFLSLSKTTFEDFYGFSPVSFRAPAWSGISNHTFAELNRLGYRVDSSATPQRLGFFSSYPRENPWLFASRTPGIIFENIFEIPTTSFIFPLAAPAFQTFRFFGSVVFLYLFILEAKIRSGMPLTLQFHPGDFVPGGQTLPRTRRRLHDLIPVTPGGIKAKYWIRTTCRKKISRITYALLNRLKHAEFHTLASYLALHLKNGMK